MSFNFDNQQLFNIRKEVQRSAIECINNNKHLSEEDKVAEIDKIKKEYAEYTHFFYRL